MGLLYDRTNELVRAWMVHLLSCVVPLYVVNEFPKSGGTQVGQMLGRASAVCSVTISGTPVPRVATAEAAALA